MLISIVNHSTISDSDVHSVIRAINRQIAEDFEPYWHFGGQLKLEGKSEKTPGTTSLVDLRGEAILYLWDGADIEDALGYHDANARGIPYGFVFTELSKELGEAWSVTLSHEALELIGDAQVNTYARGPHPADRRQQVFHWWEMCDAVQAESYEIDGVPVSNFVLPLYFSRNEEPGSRNDFLNRSGVRSFGVAPGGYIGFYNPKTQKDETYSAPGDATARRRQSVKSRAGAVRRASRYQR